MSRRKLRRALHIDLLVTVSGDDMGKKIIWRSPKGEVIACVEKNKVLQENLIEIRQVCQDALEDAVLMGCDEQQVRDVLMELIASLENPYSSGDE